MEDLVEEALKQLRPALGADGATLAYRSTEGQTLHLTLRAEGPDACDDCIVEASVMEEIVLAALEGVGAPYTAVHITDELNRTKGQ